MGLRGVGGYDFGKRRPQWLSRTATPEFAAQAIAEWEKQLAKQGYKTAYQLAREVDGVRKMAAPFVPTLKQKLKRVEIEKRLKDGTMAEMELKVVDKATAKLKDYKYTGKSFHSMVAAHEHRRLAAVTEARYPSTDIMNSYAVCAVPKAPATFKMPVEGDILQTAIGEMIVVQVPANTQPPGRYGWWMTCRDDVEELTSKLVKPWDPTNPFRTFSNDKLCAVERNAGELFLKNRKAAECKSVAVAMEAAREDKGQFILWCPESSLPPKVIHTSLLQAQTVADRMAKKEPGKKFYVARLEEVAETSLPVVTRKKV